MGENLIALNNQKLMLADFREYYFNLLIMRNSNIHHSFLMNLFKFMVCVVFYFIVLISEGKDLFDKSVVMINVMIILIFVMTIVDPLVKLFTTAFSSYSKYHQKFTQNNKIIFYDDRIEYFQSKSMMIINYRDIEEITESKRLFSIKVLNGICITARKDGVTQGSFEDICQCIKLCYK